MEITKKVGLNMIRFSMRVLALGLVAAVAMAVPASAQVSNIDYIGFGYETGGLFPSNAGDELVMEAIADGVDALFQIDLGTSELTFHVSGLISTGETTSGTTTIINYTGGTMDIYQDSAMNADWGVNPPNATAPSTFMDGDLFFRGEFSSFTLYFAPGGYGSFEGTLNGVGGSMIDGSCNGCIYTWAGSFSPEVGAQIPAGYDLQVDGVFQIDSAVDSETSSWGSVKALFSN